MTMLGDPDFVNVLIVGLTAVIAWGAITCAFLLLWIGVLLSRIERNQRNLHHGRAGP